jgi:endonuclease/exonuclease/phosphatase family metal-dependent hydrolase
MTTRLESEQSWIPPEASLNIEIMAGAAQTLPLRILTHNIRYDTGSPFKGEKPWSTRCPLLCAELVYHSMNPAESFICLQEVLYNQLEDIRNALNEAAALRPSWSYIGVGRDDGKRAGEYSPIFYRPATWKLEDSKTVWLSETPDRPSRGWDAACNRLVTIGVFRHYETQEKVVVMSTHFDHIGVKSRANSAKLILELVDKYQAWGDPAKHLPVLLAGDFNSSPDDVAYKIMTAPGSIMADISTWLPKDKRYGNRITYTSFGGEAAPSIIDFLFCNKNDMTLLQTFAVLENKFDDGIYLSDHRAVVADLTIVIS